MMMMMMLLSLFTYIDVRTYTDLAAALNRPVSEVEEFIETLRVYVRRLGGPEGMLRLNRAAVEVLDWLIRVGFPTVPVVGVSKADAMGFANHFTQEYGDLLVFFVGLGHNFNFVDIVDKVFGKWLLSFFHHH